MSDVDDGSVEEELDPEYFGLSKSEAGKWASCIRVLSPFSGETLQLTELDDNEAAVSINTCVFASEPSQIYLIIGTARNHVLNPKSFKNGSLRVYKYFSDGTLQLHHQVKYFILFRRTSMAFL